MGSCVPMHRVKNDKNKISTKKNHLKSNLNTLSNNPLAFEMALNNVKIQNIGVNNQQISMSVMYSIQSLIHIVLPLTSAKSNKIKWNKGNIQKFEVNSSQLAQKQFKISIMDDKSHIIKEIKISLFDVINGPFHYDYKIAKGMKSYGRLIFDLHVTQIVNIKVKCLRNQVSFLKQLPGEKYSFLFQFNITKKNNPQPKQHKIIQGKKSQKSCSSYINQVPLIQADKFRQIQYRDEAPSPTLREKRTASKLIKQQTITIIQWRAQVNDLMPRFEVKVKLHDFLLQTLKMKLYRHPTQSVTRQFGQCSILLSQIINQKYFQYEKSQSPTYLQQIQKSIWYRGKKVGNCKIQLQITSELIFKQKYGYTRTQDGIIKMNHFQNYKPQKKISESQNSFFAEIQQIQAIIHSKFQLKTTLEQKLDIEKTDLELFQLLKQLKQKLALNMHSSFNYQYENAKKLMEKQKILMKILQCLHTIICQKNINLVNLCWDNVIMILSRGQMMFKYWAFSQQEMRIIFDQIQLSNKRSSNQFVSKISLTLSFYEILNQLLKEALQTSYLGLQQQNKSAQIYKAYCYFKIPLFRQKIQQKLTQNNSSGILKPYSGIQQLLEQIDSSQRSIPLKNQFFTITKNNKFYQSLTKLQKGQQITQKLDDFINDHRWFEDITAKDDGFFYFFTYLLDKFLSVKEVMSGVSYFSGYGYFVRSFFQILIQTPVNQYPGSLISCAITLLQNDKLFTPIIRVILKKTNLYNVTQVSKTLTILCYLMYALSKNSFQNIKTFPYSYLISNLKPIIDCQSIMLVGQVLIIFYNNYEKFHWSFRYQLAMYLLGAQFWRLIYHWAYSIRRVYYHIIILKICQDLQLLKIPQIQQRINECLNILGNGSIIWNKQKIRQKNQVPLYNQMKNKLKYRSKINKNAPKSDHSKQLMRGNYEIFKSNIDENLKINVSNYKKTSLNNKQQIDIHSQQISQIQSPLPLTNSYILKKTPQHPRIQNQNPNGHSPKTTTLMHSNTLTIRSKIQKPLKNAKYFSQQQLSLIYYYHGNVYEYLDVSYKQFMEILKLVDQCYGKSGQLPDIKLGMNVQIDNKDLMPCQSDYSLLF